MSSTVSAIPRTKNKKTKKQSLESATVTGSSTNTPQGEAISQVIQNTPNHVRNPEAIATLSADLPREQVSTKTKKRRGGSEASSSGGHDATQPKPKKKKKQHNPTASISSSFDALSNTAQTPGISPLVAPPAYLPHVAHHIPIDPALIQTNHSHPHTSTDSPFEVNADPGVDNAYMFNPDGDMAMLGSNEELLRVLQGFDISKFTTLVEPGDPGPSTTATPDSAPQPSRPRPKKTVAPQPTGQLVNHEHADILATHWLNPAKLADLVKSQGLVYKKGKFSAIEEHQIEEALNQYAKEKNLSPTEVDAIIFSKGKKAKEEYSTFWSEITRAVPQRPIIAVYHHVRRTHHPMKQQGKWTPKEDAILISAVAELGQKWEKISERVGRMSSDCRDRYRNHLVDQDARVTGPWTKEEEEELTKIVLELTVQRGLQADNDVLWSEVSERMGGRRTRQQVRIKWTDALHKRVKNSGERPRWSAQDAYILVHKVASMPVQDDTEIDWKLLPDPQWNLWSAHQLQRRWFGLKKTLKDAESMPHSEIIAILQSKFSQPPEQPNAPRRYESKKSRTNAISREFINDEEAGLEDVTDPELFTQGSSGSSIDPELVRAQEQLKAVLEMATRQAASESATP